MENNKIILKFPNTISRITGNDYGFSIYESQIAPNIKRNVLNEIIFPEHITGISISFIQGLMGEELNRYGTEKIFDHFSFSSVHTEVKKSIEESIKF